LIIWACSPENAGKELDEILVQAPRVGADVAAGGFGPATRGVSTLPCSIVAVRPDVVQGPVKAAWSLPTKVRHLPNSR
jgi:hypothetical protein